MKPLAISRFAVTASRSPLVSDHGAFPCRLWRHGVLLLAALAVFAIAQPGSAVTMYWDTSPNAGQQSGSGTWDTTTPMWSATTAGSNPLLTWTNGYDATFSSGACTVLIGGTVSAGIVTMGNSGAATLSNGTLQISSQLLGGGGGSLKVYSDLVLLSSTVQLSGNAVTVNGNISETGGGSLLRMVGTVTLNGTNTFTGGVRLNTSSSTGPSILTVTQPAALGNSSKQVEVDASTAFANPTTTLSLSFAADGTVSNTFFFIPGAYSATIQSIGPGAAILSNTNAIGVNSGGILVLNLGGTSTAANVFAGKIINGNSTNYTIFSKTGTGTWSLTGTNAYYGATTVSAGILWINGTLHSNSAVTVSNNATLGGSGTISGSVAVVSGGILSPGAAGVGTLTVKGGLNLGSNATYNWEYGSSGADRITVGGVLQLPAVATVNVVQVSGTLPKPAVLFSAGSLSGTPYSWIVKGLSDYSVTIQNNTNVVLVPSNRGTAMLMK